MSGSRFEFEARPGPSDGPARWVDAQPREHVNPAPADKDADDDHRREEAADEPGYGHGV